MCGLPRSLQSARSALRAAPARTPTQPPGLCLFTFVIGGCLGCSLRSRSPVQAVDSPRCRCMWCQAVPSSSWALKGVRAVPAPSPIATMILRRAAADTATGSGDGHRHAAAAPGRLRASELAMRVARRSRLARASAGQRRNRAGAGTARTTGRPRVHKAQRYATYRMRPGDSDHHRRAGA